MRRVEQHPILSIPTVQPEDLVTFDFEGTKLQARKGDTIASALIANGIDIFGYTEHGNPRGFFCAIGKCSSCLVEVDGVPNVRACITPVREGMQVKRQVGRGRPKW
ncbi:(2Fe-2S)-binding protein [Fervidobacterium thailandense]|uniref:Pyridine nucleotide-disulfide oxidoreductase n=1 Tax=Fervidobacterium thailandense TaxID=1008305 RepID=A0A1E3G1R2_9BACT|nr:(2Fe-2S)-binding protein [Fervidobacterium thailandense]ODN30209.1 pyridine nucleotide-disulfide oxidoreductase [Fervidobacterium thailandense]